MDTLHVLFCPHRIFQLYKHEVVSTLQLKLLALLEEDMFPLCFLEWMLDEEYECIEGVPPNVMFSLQSMGRRNIWFSFIPSIFTQWVRWKYESTKWLAKFMCLCIESLHDLWLERCRIVHESMASKIKIEDHHNLLVQVSKLFTQVEINASSVLLQYKHRLNSLPTETLRGIAYQLLSNLNVDSHQTPFHNDILRNKTSTWRELTPEIIQRRDQATMRRYQQLVTRKRRQEEFEDMVESRLHRKCKK